MLGKTMKYELVSNGRTLLPMFGMSLVLAAFLRFLLWLAPKLWEVAGIILTMLVATLGMLLPMAITVVAFALVVMRFYRSMTGPEAYLSFTLPVSVNTHLIGRILVSTLYLLLASAVSLLASYIFLPGFSVFDTSVNTGTGSSFSLSQLGLAPEEVGFILMLILWLIVFMAISFICQQIMVFHAISLSVSHTRNRVLYSVGYYLLLSFASGMISLFSFIGIGYAWVESGSANTFFSAMYRMNSVQSMWRIYGFLWAVTGIMVLVMGAIAVAEYLHMKYMFTKKLNLE